MITGLYKHKKGRFYFALFTVKLEKTLEPLVIYMGKSGIWARPISEFNQPDRFRKVI